MNGPLAQTAALAAHAKASRSDAQLGGDDAYWRQHSTFRYVRRLSFKVRGHHLFRAVEEEVAATPAAWLATLPPRAVVSLVSLGSAGPLVAHLAAAFAGGTREGIVVSFAGNAGVWVPEWRPVAHYPETQIWSVEYVRVAGAPASEVPTSLERARQRLEGALREVSRFAGSAPGLSAWCQTFAAAEQNLVAVSPVAPYHPDIFPTCGYSLPARQLLAAAVRAYVFGGMGSWNDLGFRDRGQQEEYERLTQGLYAAVLGGLLAAVNLGASSRSAG